MRIALFSDTYMDDVNGVAKTLGRLVGHAARREHEVMLITPRVSDAPAEHAVGHRQLPGIPVPMYPELQLARGLDGAGRRMLKGFKPDLVHVATESSIGLSGRRWALGAGVPLVTSFHTNFPAYLHDYRMGSLEPLLWRYLRWFHDRSLVTFCPSRDTLETLRAHGFGGRLLVWSRGVDTELFSPARRSEDVRRTIAPGADRILIYVGRLAAEKRVGFLLDAFARVSRLTGPGTSLVFVGDGPARKQLERDAPEGVHFTGYRRGLALAEAFAAGDLFVFASDTETFGNVVLEALSSGLPAVVVDKGGVRETVHEGRTGVRVPVGDVAGFADACVTLLQDEGRRASLSEGARAEALSRDWETILDGVLSEYAAAVSRFRGGGAAGRQEVVSASGHKGRIAPG
jgi:phosphatidylinositol alpha 1,6-mannosyltransferase